MAAERGNAMTFERLDARQRAVAWAVVRSIATATWVGVVIMLLSWAFITAYNDAVNVWSLPPLAGAAGLAVMLEIKSRDLE